MNKVLFSFLVMLFLGCFLLPSTSYGCGTKSEKSCCKKEITKASKEKGCCKSNSSRQKNNPCNGKCRHSNCTTSAVNYSLISFFEIEFKNNNFEFISKKQKFYHSETYISSGFISVWLPPKIK